jgi:chemotaxis signal transduction protein
MANYKGIELHDTLHGLVRHMDDVESTREALQSLQGVWDTLAMLGQLTGIGVEIGTVRADFGALTGRLLNQLGQEALGKAALSLRSKAQVAVDVLVRNLFERTADIGFLATDDDIRAFMQADEATRAHNQTGAALTQRLRDYQSKYSVYKDIVLLAPDGHVLARLDSSINLAASSDPWTADIMASDAPYSERHAFWDMRPEDAKSLVYACRVTSVDGGRVLGALCLVFDLEDELQRIFQGLTHLDGDAEDWNVVTLINRQGRVVASSDTQQVPLGAPLEALPHGSTRAVRFAGRRWLASTCEASAYQGYGGPGWRGHVMLPLEQAFNAQVSSRGAAHVGAASTWGYTDEAVMQQLSDSPRLFSEALRDIPRSAAHIEASLTRAVWNGNVALGHGLQHNEADTCNAMSPSAPNARDVSFAKTLLREIGQTGTRTREVFTRAIAELNETVVSSVLAESEVGASLAMDLMDRNLYERANDCRWWALTARFRTALNSEQIDSATQRELTRTLQTIHGLYTVYANLILFDRHGRVVAASMEDEHCAVGQSLTAEWVRRSLDLRDAQAHVVSAFEPSALYGQRATYVYAAQVRALANEAAVGGIAIVFDSEPQFEAMLQDTLPRDATGHVKAASFGVFVDAQGQVIASTRADLRPGARLALNLSALRLGADAAHPSAAAIVKFENRLYAAGACRAVGYREYRGAEVTALSLIELADDVPAQAQLQATTRRATSSSPASHTGGQVSREPAIDVATFSVAGRWYGLPGSEVLEAIGSQHVLPLPLRDKSQQALIRGSVMLRGEPVAVLDVGALMHGKPPAAQATSTSAAQQIIIVKADDRRRFAMLVDALGDTPSVEKSRLNKAEGMGGDANRVVEYLVRPAPGSPAGEDILILLSAKRLASWVVGAA